MIENLKNRKAPWIDNITSNLMRTDKETSIKQTYNLFLKFWNDEKIPTGKSGNCQTTQERRLSKQLRWNQRRYEKTP